VPHRSQLEGIRKPRTYTELLENPELRHHGIQSSYVSALVTATHH